MSNHYAHARAPAEAKRIQDYLDATGIPISDPITTKALTEAVFASEEDQKWCQQNISAIAKYLDGYHIRGAPFKRFGRTCRAYFWHAEPEPELDPEALEVRVNQIQDILDSMANALERIEDRLDRLSQGVIIT